MTTLPASAGALVAPTLARRMACLLYEGVLLFGIVMVTGFVFGVATGQRHALVGHHALQGVLFVVLGGYFVYFWSHGGQTLAMQTWHIRLVTSAGTAVAWPRAVARYALSYLWFAPALATTWVAGQGGNSRFVAAALLVGLAAYAALSRLHPQRQYWHDVVCGTRLVDWKPVRPA